MTQLVIYLGPLNALQAIDGHTHSPSQLGDNSSDNSTTTTTLTGLEHKQSHLKGND